MHKPCQRPGLCISFVRLERIELSTGPWQGPVLPLNHSRLVTNILTSFSYIQLFPVRAYSRALPVRYRASILWVRPEGLEPPAPSSEAKCSNPLSYGRLKTVRYFRYSSTNIFCQNCIFLKDTTPNSILRHPL